MNRTKQYEQYQQYIDFIKQYSKASNAATGSKFDANSNVRSEERRVGKEC